MKLFCITIAYAPAALVARSLILYQKYRALQPYRHIVVQGHYPINERKNSNDIKLVVDCFEGVELWDPGKDLGSAQSQMWALNQLGLQDDDVWINLDPDSACTLHGWDDALLSMLKSDPNCILTSCLAPMVLRYMGTEFGTIKNIGRLNFGVPARPTPFNLSAFKWGFIREIGGLPQGGMVWGELEGGIWSACQRTGKYHAYALDFLEQEHGKFLQDYQHNNFKDASMRIPPPGQERFYGNFSEYLARYYPALLEIDTCKNLEDHNHP